MRPRDNPFRTGRLERLPYRLPGITWDELDARLAASGRRGAIVGAHGTGKTTLLEEWGGRLRGAGWVTRRLRCDAENRSFPRGVLRVWLGRVSSREIILFDGAEQVSLPMWWGFRHRSRRAGGLIITTHRAGRLPTLIECRTSAELLAELAAELLGGRDPSVPATARDLFERHGGNVREALRAWYDRLAWTAGPG